MRYYLLLFLVFYISAKAIETQELPQHLPEDLLVMSLDKISQGDIKSAINIESSLTETYKSLGYTLVKVPKLSVSERVNFILSKI